MKSTFLTSSSDYRVTAIPAAMPAQLKVKLESSSVSIELSVIRTVEARFCSAQLFVKLQFWIVMFV